MNLQNLQQENGVVNDQINTDYCERNEDSTTFKFETLNQVFKIIQADVFFKQGI